MIVVAIMIGVAAVATFIVRALKYGEPATDMIALSKQLISHQRAILVHLTFPLI
ncbi:MAG: hypothetical protein ACRD42_03480 [Nitrososphaeraceae archaeon]